MTRSYINLFLSKRGVFLLHWVVELSRNHGPVNETK